MGLLSSRRIGSTFDFYVDATTTGATGDGSTTDNAGILAAITAASALNARVFLPEGTYVIDRDGSNSYCLDIAVNDIIIEGVRGLTTIKHKTGQAGTSISLVRANEKSGLTFRDITFDGNWGNHVTTIAAGSDRAALPQATIYVESTGDMPSSGTFKIQLSDGTLETITYTGKTSTTFTGCSGGTGTMFRHDAVGYVDVNTNGINHTAQGVNPSNFGIMLRGCDDVLIENCTFIDMFGDGVWMGTPADDDLQQLTTNVRIVGCTFDICARNAISFGAAAKSVEITGCVFRWICNTIVDSEPQYLYNGTSEINVHHNVEMRGWWTRDKPAILISVVAGDTTGHNESSAARNWRITDNVIYGTIQVDGAIGCTIASNHIYNDVTDAAYAYGPIYVSGTNDGVSIYDNDIYDNAIKSAGSSGPHNGAIHITYLGNGSRNVQPAGIHVFKNRIRVRRGVHGIWVNGQGGFTYGLAPVIAPVSGTATTVTDLTLADTTKTWTNDQFIGWTVRRGSVHAMVIDNDATTLTLQPGHPTAEPYAWRRPDGRPGSTPSTGTYELHSHAGFLTIDDNHIDCGTDGNAAGGHGIYLFNDRAGSRISVTNNKIKNVSDGAGNSGWGVHVVGDSSVPALFIEIVGNRVWDDQATQTSSAVVRFASEASLTSIGKLIMRDNGQGGGSASVSSLSLGGGGVGTWLINDGHTQDWTGYGAPAMEAPNGSIYRRIDGAAATSLYIRAAGAWEAR